MQGNAGERDDCKLQEPVGKVRIMPSNRYCHLGFPPPLFVVPGFLSRREVRHANRALKQADLNDYCLVYQFSKLPTTS
jgi:hypothetical protein